VLNHDDYMHWTLCMEYVFGCAWYDAYAWPHHTMHSKPLDFFSAFGKEKITFIKEGKSQKLVQQLYWERH